MLGRAAKVKCAEENRVEQVAMVHGQGWEQHHQLRKASWVTRKRSGQTWDDKGVPCHGRSCRENLVAVNRLKLGTK